MDEQKFYLSILATIQNVYTYNITLIVSSLFGGLITRLGHLVLTQ